MKPICRTTVIFLCALLFSTTVLNQSVQTRTQRYTARQIVNIADDVYQKHDYVAAAMFWFAYIQMNPPELANNPAFNAEVQDAWQTSSDEVRRLFEMGRKADSTVAGLSKRPPQVHIPDNAK